MLVVKSFSANAWQAARVAPPNAKLDRYETPKSVFASFQSLRVELPYKMKSCSFVLLIWFWISTSRMSVPNFFLYRAEQTNVCAATMFDVLPEA